MKNASDLHRTLCKERAYKPVYDIPKSAIDLAEHLIRQKQATRPSDSTIARNRREEVKDVE